LTRGSFDLTADPPAVTVKAGYTKNKREARQPIRSDLARTLTPWLAERETNAPVFEAMPDKLPAMVRADLRRARIRWRREARTWPDRRERRASDFLRWRDGDGRVVDFHALRATYITALVKGGASVRVAQELARHSDPKLTMNVYTRLGVHDLAGALDGLPGEPSDDRQAETMKATGTDHARADDARPVSAVASAVAARKHAERCETVRDHDAGDDDGKPLIFQSESGPMRADARGSGKATEGIRTLDLCFTKAPL